MNWDRVEVNWDRVEVNWGRVEVNWGRGLSAAVSHPAERQEEVHPTRPLHTVPELPVHQMLPGKHQEAEAHGHQQHVEHPRHVVDVQFAAHHLQGGGDVEGAS